MTAGPAARVRGHLLVLWLGVTTNFLLPRLIPGDPVQFLIGEEGSRLTAEQRQTVLAQFGMDRPVLEQYGAYLAGLVRGDLGVSLSYGASVAAVIGSRLPWSLFLVGSAALLAAGSGFLLACVFHRLRPGRKPICLMGAVVAIGSVPAFLAGMVAIAVFAVKLGWFPTHGAVALEATGPAVIGSVLRHSVLPIGTLTLAQLPSFFLLARAGLEGALRSGYTILARAHGLAPWRILLWHAAPNAVLPFINHLGITLGGLVGGTVVVETLFAYPGMGSLLHQGIVAHDLPLLQGVFLCFVVAVVLANAGADLLQLRLDPRLRTTERLAS